MSRFIPSLIAASIAFSLVPARADIYQWEYINPADPSQGRQQSTTLCPDGAGQNAIPYAFLYGDLTMAYLHRANLRNAIAGYTNLNSADFTQANLTGAWLNNTTLVGANLTGAQVKGVNFQDSDLTAVQLYSTASFQAHDLAGIAVSNVSGWNLAGQNLTGANLFYATLISSDLSHANLSGVYADASIFTNADLNHANLANGRFYYATFTNANLAQANLSNAIFYDANLSGASLAGADIRGATFSGSNTISLAQLYSTASYQAHDLTGTALRNSNLSGVNFAGQNLTNADFNSARLTNASFAGASVQGAVFSGATGFTAAQLYSTASYQGHDLTGISFGSSNNLSGWNLVGQKLTNASFEGAIVSGTSLRQANLENSDFSFASLSNANLSQANLKNVNFNQANLDGANFSGADVRGAQLGGLNFFSLAQLYSTASYQAHDLTGINLSNKGLVGANLASQNLTNAWMYNADLSGANLSQANLTNVNFDWAKFTGANLSGAEIRGAIFSPNYFGGGLTLAQLYTTGSFQAHDLTGVVFNTLDLSGGNFAGQNLTNTSFAGASLAGAHFTDAEVRGTNFSAPTGFTRAQLYSTASYQAHDLSGIKLVGVDLTGADFSDQNLTGASFGSAMLAGADFSGAEIRGASFTLGCGPCGVTLSLPQLYSTASYQAHDLSGIEFFGSDLTGADFSGQNLTNTSFSGTILIGADFSRATIRGAHLGFTTQPVQGFTASQLYSTASYQAHDLTGVDLGGGNDLTGWNFAGQNLTDSRFGGATLTDAVFRDANLTHAWLDQGFLTNADFSNANLTNVRFYGSTTEGGTNFSHANLQNAQMDFYYENHTSIPVNFTGADARGAAYLHVYGEVDFVVTNFIRHDGYVAGLDLNAGQRLLVRDYDGNSSAAHGPISIMVDQGFDMAAGGTLQMIVDADDWGSTISFAGGIPVAIGGTLELSFAEDVDLASQVGRTLDLFDWTGVQSTGTFAVNSPYFWDLSNLYTAGDVVFLAVGLGDFNDDRIFNCADVDPLVAAIAAGTNPAAFDLTNDGLVNIADLDSWRAEAGAVNLGPGRAYLPADANLDGSVDGSDFGVWNAHKFTNMAAWCSGDFNADGAVDGSDFGIWNAHKFTTSDRVASVPEPAGALLALAAAFVLASRRCWGETRHYGQSHGAPIRRPGVSAAI